MHDSLTASTPVYAILGRPVAHSLSPLMHNRWFADAGIDAVYVAIDVDPTEASRLPGVLRMMNLVGVNLTVPFKRVVRPALDEVGPMAARTGAVNVVVRREDRLFGYNSDALGFIRGFEASLGESLEGRHVVVLGAGGAGAAVGAGALEAHAASVCWVNRTVGRAEALAFRMGAQSSGVGFADVGPVFASADVVVNCLDGPGATAFGTGPIERLPRHAIWCDINYWDAAPIGLTAARERGHRVLDGLPMLVHQGAIAFEHFVGITPDASSMLTWLRERG